MKSKLRRSIASVLIVSVFGMGLPMSAQAGIVGTEAAADQVRIAAVLDREEMRSRLAAYGVGPAEVKARVAALTDEEASRLAAGIDALPAGAGDPATAIGVLAYGLVIVVALVIWGIYQVGKAVAQGVSDSSAPAESSHPAADPAPKPAQY